MKQFMASALFCFAGLSCTRFAASQAAQPATEPSYKLFVSKPVPVQLSIPSDWMPDESQVEKDHMPQHFFVTAPENFSAVSSDKSHTDPTLSVMVYTADRNDRSLDDVVAHHEPPKKGAADRAGETSLERWTTRQDVKLDGEPAALLEFEPANPVPADQTGTSLEVVVLHKGLVFRFTMVAETVDGERSKKVLRKVIEGSKFLDEQVEKWQTGRYATSQKSLENGN